MKPDKQLSEYDRLISAFKDLSERFPDNEGYAESIAKLQQERTDYVNKIGKRNDGNCYR